MNILDKLVEEVEEFSFPRELADIEELPISNSQKDIWAFCKRKWFNRYVSGEKEPQSDPLRFGSLTHEVLERKLQKQPIADLEWPTEEMRDLSLLLATKALKVVMYDVAEIIMVEGNLVHDDIRVVIDFVYRDHQGKIVILDWKTSGTKYKSQMTKDSEQLATYAYIYQEITGLRVDYKAHCVLNKKTQQIQFLKVVNDEAMMESSATNIKGVLRQIRQAAEEYFAEEGNDGTLQTYFPKKDSSRECWAYGRICFHSESCFPTPRLWGRR